VVIVVYCCSVEENLWPAGSPIAKPATSANGSNCLYKLTVCAEVGRAMVLIKRPQCGGSFDTLRYVRVQHGEVAGISTYLDSICSN